MNSSGPGDGDEYTAPARPLRLRTAGALLSANDQRRASEQPFVIIDKRELRRECLAQNIAAEKRYGYVLTYGSAAEWAKQRTNYPAPFAALLCVADRKIDEPDLEQEIRALVCELAPAPLILLADNDELTEILKALECGVKGYIPSSVGINVCLEAILLSVAGGIFVPASSVFAMRHLFETSVAARPFAGILTDRQVEVAEALRRGKGNKMIAHELNLRESTVKVHVRNIMKKINATNRTEVAYKINDLFPDDPSADGPNGTRT
ncbi:DNA-binding NarL/FixJ family response regulator [Sinorhizobium kostiense]|uniref:DNA-binding NarL/FixJ family response regulator n=1 Tax=Sinorhizobium kostiense TaxID=76747 RepID=A0ABS4QU53_9HYPH|nr:response regulator transcription factor [Sinorhizobium kostiense]MBP2233579.1 DNA-binding NarL/FixJ family response regulator [Sinorhizobium kostiense]